MKQFKYWLWMILVVGTIGLTGCSPKVLNEKDSISSEEKSEKKGRNQKRSADYEEIYSETLEKIYDIVESGAKNDMDGVFEGDDDLIGVREVAAYDDFMRDLGYLIEDINGDGVAELIVGIAANTLEGHEEKAATQVLNIFSSDGSDVNSLVEGWYRNAWYILDTKELFNIASSGAAYTTIGLYRLDKDQPKCERMYFTELHEIKNGENASVDYQMKWYFSPTGIDSSEAEGVVEVTEEEFDQNMDNWFGKRSKLNLIPIGDWKRNR